MLQCFARFGVTFACSVSAGAQYELIVIEKPLHARHLAGMVSDGSGAAIPGVFVEECGATGLDATSSLPFAMKSEGSYVECEAGKHAIAWAVTDSTGHFSIPTTNASGPHSLSIAFRGFDPMRFTVNLSAFAHKELRLTMRVAT